MKRIIFSIGLVAAGLLVVSCSKEPSKCEQKEVSREIRLEKSEVVVKTGTTQVVEVWAEGALEVTSSDENAVLTQVKGNQVIINPVLGGRNAVLTVKDTKTQKTAQIKVNVEFADEFFTFEGESTLLPIGDDFEVTSDDESVVKVTSNAQGHSAVGVDNNNNTKVTQLTLKNKKTQQTQKVTIKVVTQHLFIQERSIYIIEGLTAQCEIIANGDDLKYSASENEKIALIEKTENIHLGSTTMFIKGVKRGKTLVKVSNGGKSVYLSVDVVKGDNIPFKESYSTALQVKVGQDNSFFVNGGGNFEIEIADPTKATAKLEYRYNNMFKVVVEGKTAGNTTITIKDKNSGASQQITLEVTN